MILSYANIKILNLNVSMRFHVVSLDNNDSFLLSFILFLRLALTFEEIFLIALCCCDVSAESRWMHCGFSSSR